jgi:hypothetical protein
MRIVGGEGRFDVSVLHLDRYEVFFLRSFGIEGEPIIEILGAYSPPMINSL